MCKKVLILDDDYSFAREVIEAHAMKQMSFSVADSLNRARMMIKNECYDIILANAKVPGGSSYSLKEEISSKSPSTRMIFMSSIENDYSHICSLGERCVKKNDVYKMEFI